MCPVAFRLGEDLPLNSYGLLVAFAFGIAILLVAREGPKVGISLDQVADFGFWALVSALVGSRLLYLVVNSGLYWDACFDPPAGRRDCLLVLKFWRGGLVFYGGLLGAIGASVWFAWRRGIRFRVLADAAAPSIALGHVFGRLGCLAAGCCYGKPGSGWLTTGFPRGSLAWAEWVVRSGMPRSLDATPPLHPTQLYEAFGELVLFFILLVVRSRKRFHGQAILTYLVAYPLLRSALEVFRADSDRGFLLRASVPGLARALGLTPGDALFLSTSQALSIAVAACALAILVSRIRSLRAAARGGQPGSALPA